MPLKTRGKSYQKIRHTVFVYQAPQQGAKAVVACQVCRRLRGDERAEGMMVRLVHPLDVGVADHYVGQQLQVQKTPGQALGQLHPYENGMCVCAREGGSACRRLTKLAPLRG